MPVRIKILVVDGQRTMESALDISENPLYIIENWKANFPFREEGRLEKSVGGNSQEN